MVPDRASGGPQTLPVRLILPAVSAASLLDGRTTRFRFKPAFSRRGGGLGRAARGRRFGGAVDQGDKAVERVLAVALLSTKAAGGDDEDTILGQAPTGKAREPALGIGCQTGDAGEGEAQLHCGRHLVDVLAAGTRGADKTFLDPAVIDRNLPYDRNHGAALRCFPGG